MLWPSKQNNHDEAPPIGVTVFPLLAMEFWGLIEIWLVCGSLGLGGWLQATSGHLCTWLQLKWTDWVVGLGAWTQCRAQGSVRVLRSLSESYWQARKIEHSNIFSHLIIIRVHRWRREWNRRLWETGRIFHRWWRGRVVCKHTTTFPLVDIFICCSCCCNAADFFRNCERHWSYTETPLSI